MNLLRESSPHLLVVGDLMLDHYIHGACQRLSPEAPVPVVQVERESRSLGGAGNVVCNLRALGAKVTIASAIGNDAGGEQVLELLREQGVDTSGIVCELGRT